MATVRVSREVREKILDYVSGIRNKELNPKQLSFSMLCNNTTKQFPNEALTQLVWGDYLYLMEENRLPESWYGKASYVYLHIESLDVEFQVSDPNTRKLKFPPATSYSVRLNCHSHVLADETTVLAAPLMSDETAEELKRMKADIQEISQRYDKIISMLQDLLSTYPSINKLVFAYPELRLMLPQGILDELDRKVERKPRKPRAIASPTEVEPGAMPDEEDEENAEDVGASLAGLIYTSIAVHNLKD